eukprot:TRINITY_DN3361_c0_g1_i2.p1 TRINITY_DN3361_c0_g1~~TRINITY_DN3361_c0_g1_i2.p1  ORF type:complete len:151 (+),score=20.68 TRINITY_DN3361_c0_g1_i2:121-573(+)
MATATSEEKGKNEDWITPSRGYSWVWKYCRLSKDKKKALCLLCHEKLSYCKTPTNLKSHLSVKHSDEVQQSIKEDEQKLERNNNTPLTSSVPVQNQIAASTNSQLPSSYSLPVVLPPPSLYQPQNHPLSTDNTKVITLSFVSVIILHFNL